MADFTFLTDETDDLWTTIQDELAEIDAHVYVVDVTGNPSVDDAWDTWIDKPGAAFLLDAGQKVRDKDTRDLVVLFRTQENDPADPLNAYRNAAKEGIRGSNGTVALERAGDQVHANMVVFDNTSTTHDIIHTARYLLDERYNGFTTGATVYLTRQKSAEAVRTPGKVLITGGAGNIGFATAVAFREAGYEPILSDLSAEGLERRSAELGGVDTYPVDLTDPEAVEKMAEEGNFEGLTAVALVHGFQGSYALHDLTEEKVEISSKVNGTSVDYVVRAFTPFLEKTGGAFAVVSSQAGIKAEAITGAYCLPKFAVSGYTEALAQQLKDRGVSVNTLAPGPVNTAFLRAYFERFAKPGENVDDVVAERSASMPLGRFAREDEMANALRFLAELDATGVMFAPTGGETLT